MLGSRQTVGWPLAAFDLVLGHPEDELCHVILVDADGVVVAGVVRITHEADPFAEIRTATAAIEVMTGVLVLHSELVEADLMEADETVVPVEECAGIADEVGRILSIGQRRDSRFLQRIDCDLFDLANRQATNTSLGCLLEMTGEDPDPIEVVRFSFGDLVGRLLRVDLI